MISTRLTGKELSISRAGGLAPPSLVPKLLVRPAESRSGIVAVAVVAAAVVAAAVVVVAAIGVVVRRFLLLA